MFQSTSVIHVVGHVFILIDATNFLIWFNYLTTAEEEDATCMMLNMAFLLR